MLRFLIIGGIAGLHLLTVLVLFATRKALLPVESTQGAEELAQGIEPLIASVVSGVLRTLLFPIVEIVISGRIELPTGGLVFGAIPLNSLLWGVGLFYVINWLRYRRTYRAHDAGH